jgi:hypothetical protein
MSVELPKDAEGREIPLDTTAMYGADGKVVNISRWVYCTALGFLDDFRRGWYAMGSGDRLVSTVSLYLIPPDSWEKLEDDLDRCIEESDLCMYYNNQNPDCNKCTISGNESRGCTSIALEDIKKRIRKLRGEN